MQTFNNQKPEHVLKRANDLINSATGNAIKEKTWALEILHNFIGSRKKLSQWSKFYETLMKRHLELCIDLKNPHFAKDGLHQYRNICQALDPNSLEVVIMHMMDTTESEASAARSKADKVALAAAAKVSDLDQEESPESIMLSSMTEEGAKDRTDREVVVPWLKFLWETYRAVLELLFRLPKLDKVYHKICEKAFKFCQDYNRTMEFRRLCEMLRSHLRNLQSAPARNGKAAWEWTSDLIELHLHTRFSQLEVATNLELWNEGFRTIEDIHAIIVVGRKTPKAKLMAVFYEKLTRIFWVAGNHLFHSFAWFRYYSLTMEHRRDLKADEKLILSSSVLLSALTIPSLKDVDQSQFAMDDELLIERNQHMANLLDFQTHPSRHALLADIVSKGVLQEVFPELARLYELVDLNFSPLTLVKNIVPIIAFIKSQPALAMYAVPLQKVITLRVVQQLSRVYSVIKLDYLRNLLKELTDITAVVVEKLIVDSVLRRELQLTVDHAKGCIHFVHTPVEQLVDNSVTKFATELHKANLVLQQQQSQQQQGNAVVEARKQFFAQVIKEADSEHAALLNRKTLVEQRKADIERALEEKERAQQQQQNQEEAKRQQEEQARLEAEKVKREEEKRRKLLDKEDVKRVQRELERLGVVKDEAALSLLDTKARQALINEAKSELVRAKEEEVRKVNEQARRLDHVTRALRIEAGEVIKQQQQQQLQRDQERHEEQVATALEAAKKTHALKVEEKIRLARMQAAVRKAFESQLEEQQRKKYNDRVNFLRTRALHEHRERKVATARRRYDEELERQRDEEEFERDKKDREARELQEQQQYQALRAKREQEQAEQLAKERQEEALKEERRKEIELKRLKTLEDKKREKALLEQQQQQQQQPVSTVSSTKKPDAVVDNWRSKDTPAKDTTTTTREAPVASVASLDESTSESGAEWQTVSGKNTNDTATATTTTPAKQPYRPPRPADAGNNNNNAPPAVNSRFGGNGGNSEDNWGRGGGGGGGFKREPFGGDNNNNNNRRGEAFGGDNRRTGGGGGFGERGFGDNNNNRRDNNNNNNNSNVSPRPPVNNANNNNNSGSNRPPATEEASSWRKK